MAGEAAAVTTSSGGATVIPDTASTGGPSGIQGSDAGGATSIGSVGVPTDAPADWSSGLPESAKLYVTQKGFKDAASVVDSYQNLEKLMGAPKERLLRIPDKADAPEWGEVYEKLGRPKNAADYKFAPAEGMESNKEFTDWAQKQFHSLGLTRQQGETLAAKWNEFAVGSLKTTSEQQATQLKTEQTALRKEWGAAYDQQIKGAQKAALTFGLKTEDIDKLEKALGFSGTMKFMAKIGEKVGEDSFVTGGNNAFEGALTPERAQAQIVELKKDKEWTQRYLAGNYEAKAKMEKLMKFAFPDLPQD